MRALLWLLVVGCGEVENTAGDYAPGAPVSAGVTEVWLDCDGEALAVAMPAGALWQVELTREGIEWTQYPGQLSRMVGDDGAAVLEIPDCHGWASVVVRWYE